MPACKIVTIKVARPSWTPFTCTETGGGEENICECVSAAWEILWDRAGWLSTMKEAMYRNWDRWRGVGLVGGGDLG